MATAPFCLVKEPTAWWPVRFNVPADGGAVIEQVVEVKFARLSRSDFEALWGAAAQQDADDESNRRLFDRVVRDWRGIADDKGAAVPFADPWIGLFLDVPGVPEAFGRAYGAFWAAQPEAALGNFAPSPAGGVATVAGQPVTSAEATSQRRSPNGARRQNK